MFIYCITAILLSGPHLHLLVLQAHLISNNSAWFRFIRDSGVGSRFTTGLNMVDYHDMSNCMYIFLTKVFHLQYTDGNALK